MSVPLQYGIARIRGTDRGAIHGTGFLISSRHIMTAAHVVNEALGWDWDHQDEPAEPVWVEFPFATRPVACAARITAWRPPGDDRATDIAVLALETELPPRHYELATTQPRPGQSFWTRGFPVGQDGGMDASGVLGTTIEHGRMLAQGVNNLGFFIEGGFSGAPLFDTRTGRVLGMAVQATVDGSKRTAFILPPEQLELAWPPLARPYKGLETFEESDARFFHGRESYVDQLADALTSQPLIALTGPSGGGKSSLVRAGLIPRLRSEGNWHIIMFRPRAPIPNDPLANLAAALLDALGDPAADGMEILRRQADADALKKRLHEEPAAIVPSLLAFGDGTVPTRVLIVVDQFEELFTVAQDPRAAALESTTAAFVDCLLAATRDTGAGLPARCLLTVRADYLGYLLAPGKLADALRGAYKIVDPMNAAEVWRAIEAPAHDLGVEFAPGLVLELVRAVDNRPNALPLLEFTLQDLWKRQQNRMLSRPPQPDSTDVPADMLTAALEQHADKIYGELLESFEESEVRGVLLDLTWVADPARGGEDARRGRPRHDFDETAWEIVEQLAAGRLVTIYTRAPGDEPTAEIVHEALIREWHKFRDWLEQDRKFRVWLQWIEVRMADWRVDPDSNWLDGKRLEEALEWQSLRPEETRPFTALIQQSRRRRNRGAIDEIKKKVGETEKKLKSLSEVRLRHVAISPFYDRINEKYTHPVLGLIVLGALLIIAVPLAQLIQNTASAVTAYIGAHTHLDIPVLDHVSAAVNRLSDFVDAQLSAVRDGFLSLLVWPIPIAGVDVAAWMPVAVILAVAYAVWFVQLRKELVKRTSEKISELNAELKKQQADLASLSD